jgi:small subunit ribosomal protein S19
MSRSIWKGPFLDKSLFSNLIQKKSKKIWSRRSIISAEMIGTHVLIYNGKIFKRILITREHVGFKYGSFAATRTFIPKSKTAKKK